MLPEPIKIGCVTLFNIDCMELLKESQDQQYDLAICDPPYGKGTIWKSKTNKEGYTISLEEQEEMRKWDYAPDANYFSELKRVSKKRIIWGGNYFLEYLGSCRGPIIWDKGRRAKGHPMLLSDGEFAWSDCNGFLRICTIGQTLKAADRRNSDGRWHGTQKPIYLYKWLLERYPKKGDKILDTHLGSGTHAMACLDLGFELTACEISEKYFNEAVKRIKEYVSSHEKIFDVEPVKLEEEGIF